MEMDVSLKRLFLIQHWHGSSNQKILAHLLAVEASNFKEPVDG
jgi:hypothetical protein